MKKKFKKSAAAATLRGAIQARAAGRVGPFPAVSAAGAAFARLPAPLAAAANAANALHGFTP